MMADSPREAPPSTRQSGGADNDERGDSPRRDDRRHSRSPRRERRDDKPKRKDAGFKWKEKRRDDDDREERSAGLQRGYRDHYRPRSRSRSPRPRSPRRQDRERDREENRDRDRNTNRDRDRDSTWRRDLKENQGSKEDQEAKSERKEKKKEKKAAPVNQQPMIIVTVNDRLGTKKAIPCFASDSVKDFKIIVASMIGRQPHEILLKRQGERPFKDQLTLQDYGVSNNVQLDLEVDTGD